VKESVCRVRESLFQTTYPQSGFAMSVAHAQLSIDIYILIDRESGKGEIIMKAKAKKVTTKATAKPPVIKKVSKKK
jgi:hypothetical protein